MKTLHKVSIGGAVVLAIAVVAIAVKGQHVPKVKDAYFRPDFDSLKQVPAGIVALRPSSSPDSFGDPVRNLEEGDTLMRAVGRNVTLRDLFAEAFGCDPGRVILPSDAPRSDFDFLVTDSSNPRELLQAVIVKQLGYTAHHETLNTNVWMLRVENPDLPGLTISPDGESERIYFEHGRLYFQHKTLDLFRIGLEDGLAQPVVDDTGLTGRYDYSLAWNERIQETMKKGDFNLDRVQQVLHGLGLKLEQGTTDVDTLIVEKAR